MQLFELSTIVNVYDDDGTGHSEWRDIHMSRIVQGESAVTVLEWARTTWLTQWQEEYREFTLALFEPSTIVAGDRVTGGVSSTIVDDRDDHAADWDAWQREEATSATG